MYSFVFQSNQNVYQLSRLYTGPKDTSVFNHLATEPYKNIMKNNIKMEDSFNPTEISIQKVLNESNTALFQFEENVPENYKCLVRHNSKVIQIE